MPFDIHDDLSDGDPKRLHRPHSEISAPDRDPYTMDRRAASSLGGGDPVCKPSQAALHGICRIASEPVVTRHVDPALALRILHQDFHPSMLVVVRREHAEAAALPGGQVLRSYQVVLDARDDKKQERGEKR